MGEFRIIVSSQKDRQAGIYSSLAVSTILCLWKLKNGESIAII